MQLEALLWSLQAEARKPPPPVTLTFAWAPGDVATIETTTTEVNVVTGQPRRELFMTSFDRLTVREAANALGVVFATDRSGTSLTRLDGVDQPEDPVLAELFKSLAVIDLDVLVSNAGAWNGVADAAVLQYRLEEAFGTFQRELLGRISDPEARARADANLGPFRAATKPEVAVGQVAADWSWEVAFWSGATLEVGSPYTVDVPGKDPIAGQPLSNTATFTVTGTGPCRKGRGSPQCADLEVRIVADPVALSAATKRMVEQTLSPEVLAAAGDFEVSVTSEQLHVGRVEVATLRPWSWTRDITTHSEVTLAAGGQVNDQTKHREKTWTWTP